MSTNKSLTSKVELIGKITNILICEDCKKHLYPPIKIHKENFNIICSRCAFKYSEYNLEDDKYITKIGELLEFPCFYKEFGCKELCTWQELKLHENACPFRQYKCPMANSQCPWEGSSADLRTHFFSSHYSFGPNYIRIDICNNLKNYVIEEHGELFVFQTKCDTIWDLLRYNVRLIGPPQRAPRFHFKIELFIDEDHKYVERKQVDSDETWDVNEGEALSIRIGLVKAMLMNSNDIYLKVEISARVPLYNGQIDQALMHEVECPVCKDHMIRPIRMCESGHNICNNCHLKLTECPTCRAKFNNTRNISLESLSEQMHYRCMYYNEGCIFTDVPDNIKCHEMICEASYYDCPLKQLVNCKWRGSIGQVCIHASKEHQFKI